MSIPRLLSDWGVSPCGEGSAGLGRSLAESFLLKSKRPRCPGGGNTEDSNGTRKAAGRSTLSPTQPKNLGPMRKKPAQINRLRRRAKKDR